MSEARFALGDRTRLSARWRWTSTSELCKYLILKLGERGITYRQPKHEVRRSSP
jgi:hypothetical protein